MTANPLISVAGVSHVLPGGAGPVATLKDVSVALHGGDLTLLTGPSGSGKTTLLSILGCLRRPTQGEVTVLGRRIDPLAPEALAALRRSTIGFVFQSYNLFPTLTARENLHLALDAREWRGEDRAGQVERALRTVGLQHRAHARPGALSGGEQQRLAVARAIVSDARIVLADEPTSALDSSNGRVVMELLARIAHETRASVMVVTHDPRIEAQADRIVRIEDGRIVEDARRAGAGRNEPQEPLA